MKLASADGRLFGPLVLVLLIAAAAASPPARGTLNVALDVALTPEQPIQGTVFLVTVRGHDPRAPELEGRFAGEPLHFQPLGDGSLWAVAAVPVDSAGTLPLELTGVGPDGIAENVTTPVHVARGRYAMERLRVAPEFGAPLSPALAARVDAEAARAMNVGRHAHDTPPLWRPGGLVRPRSTRVTSGFGNGREFNGRVVSRHTGTDFQGAVGDPVNAAARGVVRIVDRFYLGGNVVYLDHGGGLSTAYLHLSRTLVAVGDTVEAGQRIGSVGATGRVTGPHLHWIVRFGEVSVDPLSVLGLEPPRATGGG